MNDQLKRIRQKDYSSIDQKLFQNMTRADNLNSTLSHLSQFQKFLMEQITTLNQPSKVAASSAIANNISKNFDSLRESLVNCSRAIGQNDRKSSVSLKKTLTSVKNLVAGLKNEVSQQIKAACKKVQEEAKVAFQELACRWAKQRKLKEDYFEKCTSLERERTKLLREIQELKQLNDKNNNKLYLEQQITLTENSRDCVNQKNLVNNVEALISQFKAEPQSSHTPLREQNINQTTPYTYEDRSWKITKVKEGNHTEQRKMPASRQNSNHRLHSKSNMSTFKQNELLLKKGVKEQRGKSRQKIKLVSMM